jgi:N-acetylmuramoyl-L-alanine amidase
MTESKSPKWHVGAFYQEVGIDGKELPWPGRNIIGPIPLWVSTAEKPTLEVLNDNLQMPLFLKNNSPDITWKCIGFFVTGWEGDVIHDEAIEDAQVLEEEKPLPPIKGRFKWILDAGHGALTPGKRSPKLKSGKQLLEYEFNRDIVKRIHDELNNLGYDSVILVPEVNIGDELNMRVDRANKLKTDGKKKIFVSVHGNAFGDGANFNAPKGVETWFFHGSKIGERIATEFQNKLVRTTRMTDRGIKSRPTQQFYVLRKTAMPAILTENGFYTNLEEVQNMLDPGFRKLIVDAHVSAIVSLESDMTFNV